MKFNFIHIFRGYLTVENKQDFVIADGVLTKYTGSGGDVTIPESIKKIIKPLGTAAWR